MPVTEPTDQPPSAIVEAQQSSPSRNLKWKGKRSQTHKHEKQGEKKKLQSRSTPNVKNMVIFSANICTLSKAKWQALLRVQTHPPPDAIVLTELNIDFTHTPDYVEETGWKMYLLPGPNKKGKHTDKCTGGVALFIRTGDFKVETEVLMSNESHQIVTWTLTKSNRGFIPQISITGAYFAPRPSFPVADTIKAMDKIKENFRLPTPPTPDSSFSDVYHIIVGDFNAHTGEAVEDHLTQVEKTYIPTRKGDPLHPPRFTIDETSATTEPQQRGYLLMKLINDLQLLILNGRFEQIKDPPPLTTNATIIGYIMSPKQTFGEVVSCRVFKDSNRATKNDDGEDVANAIGSDHKLISVTLNLPIDPAMNQENQGNIKKRKAPRTQYHYSKLKQSDTAEKFKTHLEIGSTEARKKLDTLKRNLMSEKITKENFLDNSHLVITKMIQEVAEKTLGSPSRWEPKTQHATPEKGATSQQTPLPLLPLYNSITAKKANLRILKNQQTDPQIDLIQKTVEELHILKQKIAIEKQFLIDQEIHKDIGNITIKLDQSPVVSAWKIWRHYKESISTEGAKGLPTLMRTNRSQHQDPSRWIPGHIPPCPRASAKAWHQHRYALGHHLRGHPLSPWDEAELREWKKS